VTAARIVIFAKAPVTGKVKTRLIPALGADGAALLASQMLTRTVAEAVAAGVDHVELCADPDPAHPDWERHIPRHLPLSAQGEGDLGDRLARTAQRVIAGGERVILIGTDCPDLDRRRLAAAAQSLETHDAVIHCARDGGYVLLGLARFDPNLFSGIAWSTGRVAKQTLARIETLGWSLHVGETLRDVDVPADLA
jgi:rSAM/selenodomain-associated transferase 1